MPSRNVRLQLNLPEERVKQLEKLMDEAGIATKKDLFNTALTLFEWAISESKEGRRLASLDEKGGTERILVMPALSHVSSG